MEYVHADFETNSSRTSTEVHSFGQMWIISSPCLLKQQSDERWKSADFIGQQKSVMWH